MDLQSAHKTQNTKVASNNSKGGVGPDVYRVRSKLEQTTCKYHQTHPGLIGGYTGSSFTQLRGVLRTWFETSV